MTSCEKFVPIKSLVDNAFEDISIGCVETNLSFCNRPNVSMSADGIDKYTIEHQVFIQARSADISIEMDAIMIFQDSCILGKSESEIKKSNVITGFQSFKINSDVFGENHNYITLTSPRAIKVFQDVFGGEFELNKQQQFGHDYPNIGSTNNVSLSFFNFILSTLSDTLKNDINSTSFKAFKDIEIINKKGIDDALTDFKRFFDRTSF